MWKDHIAVSPIIAAILLVGITVVLSSVVYLTVIGLGGQQNHPIADLSAGTISGVAEDKITVTSINKPAYLSDIKILLLVGDEHEVQTVAESYSNVTWPSGISSVTFVDQAENGMVDTGDHFLIDAAQGTEVALYLQTADGDSVASIAWTSM